MLEFYPAIRSVHIVAISASGLWMALRLLGLLFAMRWPRHWLAWTLGLAIDGTVLTAATMLYSILPPELFANHWLAEKLVLVGVYFVCGYAALIGQWSRARTTGLAAVAALAFGLAYARVPF